MGDAPSPAIAACVWLLWRQHVVGDYTAPGALLFKGNVKARKYAYA